MIEFKKTHKTQYAKCIQLMQQYALIAERTRMTISNGVGETNIFNVVLKTNPGENGFEENVIAILGRKKFAELAEF